MCIRDSNQTAVMWILTAVTRDCEQLVDRLSLMGTIVDGHNCGGHKLWMGHNERHQVTDRLGLPLRLEASPKLLGMYKWRQVLI